MTFCCVPRLLFGFSQNLVTQNLLFKAQFSSLGILFCFFLIFLMHNLKWLAQLKTNNNLHPKIYYENVMSIALPGPSIAKNKRNMKIL